MKITRELIYKAIDGERWYQDEKWGTEEHANHEIESWMIYMESHLNKAKILITEGNEDEALHSMRKVVALGIACFEKHGVPLRDISDGVKKVKKEKKNGGNKGRKGKTDVRAGLDVCTGHSTENGPEQGEISTIQLAKEDGQGEAKSSSN